jgi:hypothetical protein
MKAVFRIDKKGNFDSFVYLGPGKVPPFIPPANRDEPKDTGPPDPPKDDKPKPN